MPNIETVTLAPDRPAPARDGAEGRPRILFVETAPGVGGSVTNVLYPMVTGLDRSRYEPLVLFYRPNPYREKIEAAGVRTLVFDRPRDTAHAAPITRLQSEHAAVFDALRAGGWRRSLYHALGSYVRLGYVIPQILRLARVMRAARAQLVHLNRDHGWVGREVVLAAKLAGLPVLCYAQNFTDFQHADRQIARLVDYPVFCSDAIGRHCAAVGGIDPQRGRTIYPGVAEPDLWARPYDTAAVRRSFGWTDADFVVGNIGRLIGWKGQDVFLRALAEVQRQAPGVKGLIVGGDDEARPGQPSYGDQLVSLARELGLSETVRFTGFRTDIPPLTAALDVLVHSSTDPEPFATTVIEALFAARPVIAMRAGGMPEMVTHGVTGLLAPPRDPPAMAQAILACYRDREYARRMGLAGQQAARERLTARHHIGGFEALYAGVFAGRPAPAAR